MNERPKDQADDTPTIGQRPESIWRLYYRYLWPFQHFQDVTRGDRRQQHLSYQYNRSMRFCLPGFMVKWSVLAALWFAWGAFLEGRANLVIPMATCFLACSFSLIVVVLLGIGWLWLDRFAERF